MSRIVVVGASQYGRFAIDAIDQRGDDTVVGLVDDEPGEDAELSGYPVLGPIDDLVDLVRSHRLDAAVVAVGDNWTRSLVVARVRALCPSLRFATVIHPSAQIGVRTVLGAGTVAQAGVIVNNDCHVGEHVYLGTACSVDHDGRVDDYASLSPNVATGGGTSIGAFTAIGVGAAISHGVTIGDHSVIGAGSVVVRDQPSHVVAFGSPATVRRRRVEGDAYL